MGTASAETIHAYWFGDTSDWAEVARRNKDRWFKHGQRLDDEIRERFGDAVQRARDAALEHRASSPLGALSLVLLLDQFPRHIFRGSARAFASDAHALRLCRQGIDGGLDLELSCVEQTVFYLPLQHAESLEAQALGVRLMRRRADEAPEHLQPFMRETLRYAELHKEIVERFGRFPHRNEAMGRPGTGAERAYLEEGGQRFGQ